MSKFKKASKKMNGALLYKIYEICARKCLNMVNLQYQNIKVSNEINHNQAVISRKQLMELF
jgi:hypothetical protein